MLFCEEYDFLSNFYLTPVTGYILQLRMLIKLRNVQKEQRNLKT